MPFDAFSVERVSGDFDVAVDENGDTQPVAPLEATVSSTSTTRTVARPASSGKSSAVSASQRWHSGRL